MSEIKPGSATESVKLAAPPARTKSAPRKKTATQPAVAITPPPTAPAIAVTAHMTGATTEKNTKTKKPKMVRDSFSFPKAEYAVLQELKERSIRLTHPAKKTELLRAAIKTLASLDDAAFIAAIQAIPSLKTGRPAKIRTE